MSTSSSSADKVTTEVIFEWTDPSNIGAGTIRIYDNRGNPDSLFPDYNTVRATVAAGVQQWESYELCDGLWVFGFRVYDGSVEELNTCVTAVLRIENGWIVENYPAKPTLLAEQAGGGKVRLICSAHNSANTVFGTATKCKFFTNDGAGGAVDYTTPLGGDFISLSQVQEGFADYYTGAYGATARLFGCRTYTAGGVASLDATEISITPSVAAPGEPADPTLSEGRG
jgi:hypothetical protein